MVKLRSEIIDISQREGKQTTTVIVRATNKAGAAVVARLASVGIIPIRSQQVIEINNLSNSRIFDQWEVQVQDRNELNLLGR